MTGGVVIPSAYVLSDRAIATSFGNYQEPRFGSNAYQRNLMLGLGIFKNVEVFGRFADYTNSPGGVYLNGDSVHTGVRDLSANVKVQIPFLPARGPQLAIGMSDLGGGNRHFKSTYAVASHQLKVHAQTLTASLGYAHQSASNYGDAFDGIFGGLEWQVGPTGLAFLAEYDGRTPHVGGRWQTPKLRTLGDLQMGATLQRSFGAQYPNGEGADDIRYAVHVYWPVGHLERHRTLIEPIQATGKIPPATTTEVVAPEAQPRMPVRVEQLEPLRHALENVGLERVRVGLRPYGLPNMRAQELVVEYENHRYAHNEVDALGIVFGVASGMDSAEIHSIRAITLKDGLRVYETQIDAAAYRAFLRQGTPDAVRESLVWSRGTSGASDSTQWESDRPTAFTRLRFELWPGLNYALGTEVGAFDYAVAAKPKLIVPLWAGARVTTGYSIPLTHSENVEDGRALTDLRHASGLETVALGQSLWMSRHVLLHLAAGRFHFDAWGAQSDVALFVPGTSDLVRVSGEVTRSEFGDGSEALNHISDHATLALRYRHVWTPAHSDQWTEIGWQRFSDGSYGPTFEWTRWSSDVGVSLFARQGGQVRFVGLKVTLPLTPRKGMKPRLATIAGPGQYDQSLRTMVGSPINYVQPNGVRETVLVTNLDTDVLNGGRMSPDYLRSQLYRMREAYFLYAESP